MQLIYNFLIGLGAGAIFIIWTKINQINKENRIKKEEEKRLKEEEI